MKRHSSIIKESIKRSSRNCTAWVEEYFRLRDFEYVQPIYDLSFLLEINALSKGEEIPKYRIFSLWKAAYKLDGYSTLIDRWLDGTIPDENLDYVPSSRIRQYLWEVKSNGQLLELKKFRSKRFARCLRLRSVRGMGPKQIAATVSNKSIPKQLLNNISNGSAIDTQRFKDLFNGTEVGPWQTAHVIPPLLRFLRIIEDCHGAPIEWDISGIKDPFQPITGSVQVGSSIPNKLREGLIDQALISALQFYRKDCNEKNCFVVEHQMGWSFRVTTDGSVKGKKSIKELASSYDPLSSEESRSILSDLHLHTAWSDGSASIIQMADAISSSGLKFFAITDHSRSSKLQNGLTPVLWLRQASALAKSKPACQVLHGIEVDILRDGNLDLPQALLAASDLVVASVHSNWAKNARENTDRLLKAIESGSIDILAHPTSAVIGKPGVPNYLRLPSNVNWGEVFEACSNWRVALEMNCFPSRLDLPLPLLKNAIKAGCAISLGSDAHARSHLQNIKFGEAALRKVNAPLVLNRLSIEELKQWITESRLHRKSITKSCIISGQSEFHFESKTPASILRLSAFIQPHQAIPVGSRVVGIDLTAGVKLTGLAVLDGTYVETCSLSTDTEILDYISNHQPKIVSIDSPLGLPGGGDNINPSAGIMRVAEYDLASIGIPAYPSLIDSMKELTLRGIRLRKSIEAFPNPPRVIESYPGAAQDILSIPRKQKSMDLLREGLRNLGLHGPGLDTQSDDEIDAITSAIVGRYFEANCFEPMGIESEAQLIVPKIHPLAFVNQIPVICLAGKTGAGKSVVARYLSVFYGFTWSRTRKIIRDLLLIELKKDKANRVWKNKVDEDNITEGDLQQFGAYILNERQQVPLRKYLNKELAHSTLPIVVDSIRDVEDVDQISLGTQRVFTWYIDCPDTIIQKRLRSSKKLGKIRQQGKVLVDRNAESLQRQANQIISNSGSLEELRWAVDDVIFSTLDLNRPI